MLCKVNFSRTRGKELCFPTAPKVLFVSCIKQGASRWLFEAQHGEQQPGPGGLSLDFARFEFVSELIAGGDVDRAGQYFSNQRRRFDA